MDFGGSITDLRNATSNHNSALQFLDHVTAYLSDELNHKAIYGPFDEKPFGYCTHISPFITRHKPDSQKRRVIIDSSWPDRASVNHFTSSNEYIGTALKLNYPSIDSYTERLQKLGKVGLRHKIDLSHMFRQLKVDPCDYPLLLRGHMLRIWAPYGVMSYVRTVCVVIHAVAYVESNCLDCTLLQSNCNSKHFKNYLLILVKLKLLHF